MYNNIVPHKLIIDFFPDGTLKSVVELYQKKHEDGSVDPKYHSISVTSQASVPQMNTFLNKVRDFVKKQEGIQPSIAMEK